VRLCPQTQAIVNISYRVLNMATTSPNMGPGGARMCGNSCMSGNVIFGLCAPKAKILRIRAEYTEFSTHCSHLVMAFVCGPVDSTDVRARNCFRSRTRGRVPAARPASLHVCMCGNGVPPTRTHSVTCCGLKHCHEQIHGD
jgi:hypothetical protein